MRGEGRRVRGRRPAHRHRQGGTKTAMGQPTASIWRTARTCGRGGSCFRGSGAETRRGHRRTRMDCMQRSGNGLSLRSVCFLVRSEGLLRSARAWGKVVKSRVGRACRELTGVRVVGESCVGKRSSRRLGGGGARDARRAVGGAAARASAQRRPRLAGGLRAMCKGSCRDGRMVSGGLDPLEGSCPSHSAHRIL